MCCGTPIPTHGNEFFKKPNLNPIYSKKLATEKLQLTKTANRYLCVICNHYMWLLGVCAVFSQGGLPLLLLGTPCFIIINLLPRAHCLSHWNLVFIVDLSQVAYKYCKSKDIKQIQDCMQKTEYDWIGQMAEFQECVLLCRTHFLSRLPCAYYLTGICSFTQSRKWQVTLLSQKAFQLKEWKKDLLNIDTESIV